MMLPLLHLLAPRSYAIVPARPFAPLVKNTEFRVVRFTAPNDGLARAANGAGEDFVKGLSRLLADARPTDGREPSGTGTAKMVVETARVISVRHSATLNLLGPYPLDIVDSATFTDIGGQARRLTAGAMFRVESPWLAILTSALDANRKKRGAPSVAESGGLPAEWGTTRWTWEPRGVHLVFAPGEIGPRAVGGDDVLVPWAKLRPHLKKKFQALLP